MMLDLRYVPFLLMAFCLGTGHAFTKTDNTMHQEGKLLFVHVIFRHGNRTPTYTYPTDPYGDPSYWETGWGQLTNIGKQSQFLLGSWLRERYRSLVGPLYRSDEIYVQSSNVDRTIMSAQATLAGLYPPTGSDVWNEQIDWQPIPVHEIPLDSDNLITMTMPCQRYLYELQQYFESADYQAVNSSLESLYEQLTTYTQSGINSPFDLFRLYDSLWVEDQNNLTLPEWTKEFYTEPIDERMLMALKIWTDTPQLARLKAGPLLKTILERFRRKLNQTLKLDRSLWIYSGHDFGIANLLNAMGMFKLHNPPFSACLLFELRECSSSSGCVSMYYKNGEPEPEPMNIPGCGTSCPLDQMFELFSEILPINWTNECEWQQTPAVTGTSFDLAQLLVLS